MKALIVDDDDSIVEVIRDEVHWQKLGIEEVRTAYNAAGARKILSSEKVDLIISDIEMPQESGLELLAWFQEQEQDGKFILLTAHENFAYVRQALQLQAADYLLKPFQVNDIELVLRKIITQMEKERGIQTLDSADFWRENSPSVSVSAEGKREPILGIRAMKALLEERKQRELMEMVKREIETRLQTRTLDSKTLRMIRMEFQQGIYAYLAANGVMISSLMEDQELAQTMERAERSPMDLLRWSNAMTTKSFAAVEENQRAQTLPAQIDAWIQDHYAERIGRNEIGEAFHMVPEYLAKVYKKKTGITIKDAINEVRIGRAKLLLEQTDQKIIEIALETGFDNVPYFSTLFKKITGVSPVDWRRQRQK